MALDPGCLIEGGRVPEPSGPVLSTGSPAAISALNSHRAPDPGDQCPAEESVTETGHKLRAKRGCLAPFLAKWA